MPPPKRRNVVLRLYDGPLYRDWAFWMTAGWGLLAAVSIPTEGQPTSLPVWLDTLLAVIFFVTAFGMLPTWIRLLIRRWQWRRRHQPSHAHAAPPASASPPSRPVPRAAPPADTTTRAAPKAGPATRAAPPGGDGRLEGDRPLSGSQVLESARSTLPHPAARAVRALQRAGTPKEQYEALLDAAEILTITIAVTAAALIQGWSGNRADSRGHRMGVGRRNVSALRSAYLGSGAMFGTWTAFLDNLRPLAADHPQLVPGLLAALGDTPEDPGMAAHLTALRQERNRAAHGNKPRNQHESALRVTERAHHLEKALAKAQFLKDVPWLQTVSCSYQPKSHTFAVVADHAMGDHPDFERRTFTWAAPVADDMFYVLGPEGPVPLSPFVAGGFCPQCRQVEVCYTYRAGKEQGPATLKSFAQGHDISAPGLGDDIRALPDRRRDPGAQ
ncbi:hypothetical protein [Streptomyces sp. 8N706]|uniref:hypothetical protein n=1 Tax=Streptomyces sp. 8N706 TaxID=3457416 RepID=UPI003FD2273D